MYSSDVRLSSLNRSSLNPSEKEAHDTSLRDIGSFLGHTISQVTTHPTTRLVYRDSNRGSVALGVVGGLVGMPLGAGLVGLTVGSNVGAPVGAAVRVVMEKMKIASPSRDKTIREDIETGVQASSFSAEEAIEEDASKQIALDISVVPSSSIEGVQEAFFSPHLVEMVDQAGHYGAVASIATAVVAGVVSLSIGNPLPVAMHVTGVCSGAAWSFGLVTGASHWLLSAAQQHQETVVLP